MSALTTVALLLATYALQTIAQNGCNDYSVKVDQKEFVNGLNLNLTCNYTGNPDYISILWETTNSTQNPYRSAYTYHRNIPGNSRPSPGFEDKLNGTMEGETHILTILNADRSDQLNMWKCIVQTIPCPFLSFDEFNLNLIDAYYLTVNVSIDGNPFEDNIESGRDVEVTCTTLSDPQPESLLIENVEVGTPHCERVPGPPPQPMNCLTTGKISKSFNLHKETKAAVCKAKFMSEPNPVETNGEFKIIMKLRSGEITLIVFLALIGVACLGILIYCIIKMFFSSKESYDKSNYVTCCDSKGTVQ